MRRPTLSELRGARVRWLLTVEALGRTWRWSSEPVDVTDGLGNSYRYDGGLPTVEIVVATSPEETVAQPQPVNVEIHWPDALALLSRGLTIRGTGELAWWPAGLDYRDRYPVVRGEITASSHGASRSPVAITLTPAVAEEGAEEPSAEQSVTEEGWPEDSGGAVPPDALGAVYPVVFGSPGQVGVRDSGSAIFDDGLYAFPGSPAHAVEAVITYSSGSSPTYAANKLLICRGRVSASAVTIMYPSTSGTDWIGYEANTESDTDALGRTVAVVDVSASTSAPTALRESSEFYVSWQTGYSTQRHAIIGDDGQAVTGAGGVIDWLLRRSTVAYDSSAWLGVRAYLDAWRVDAYLDEPVGPWDWVAETLLPGLPVSVVTAAHGVSPVIWRPDAARTDAMDHLRAGSNCSRVGALTLHSVDEATATATYAGDADSGTPRDEITLSPEPDPAAGVGGTIWAKTARDLLAADGASTVDAWWTCDRATASAVAAWRTTLAAGWYEVEYEVDQDRGFLGIGSVVLLTDADVNLTSHPAQIAGITYRDSGVLTLRLVVWRSPAVSSSSVPLDDTPVVHPQ